MHLHVCVSNVKVNPFYDADIYSSISKKTKITDMCEGGNFCMLAKIISEPS